LQTFQREVDNKLNELQVTQDQNLPNTPKEDSMNSSLYQGSVNEHEKLIP
jgi:hypothetical protein